MGCNTSGCSCGKLCAGALGMAVGIAWAIGVVVLGIVAWQFHYGDAMVNTMSSVYFGYAGSLKGIGFGALWAFIDGFIGGFIVGWVYNLVVKCCGCKVCNDKCDTKPGMK